MMVVGDASVVIEYDRRRPGLCFVMQQSIGTTTAIEQKYSHISKHTT